MNLLLKFAILFSTILLAISCQSPKEEAQKNQTKTIIGIVKTVEPQTDGCTSEIQTLANEEIYTAIISVVNLGGPQNYQELKVGDIATLTGDYDLREGQKYLIVTKIDAVESPNKRPTISETSFEGISPGDKIADHTDKLTKDILKDGEGDFEIFRFNNIDAYCMAHPMDESIIGDIYILSNEPKTEKGIHIGSTFEDLVKAHPNLEVHGSEIEGRTYASSNNKISFRLDVQNYTYEVDLNAIPKTAKVIEIVINRS